MDDASSNSTGPDGECGDGVVDRGEACDDRGESAACNIDCTEAERGDGVSNASAGEDCDDAGESATCNGDCTIATCGDGVRNGSASEGCDDGNDIETDGCLSICEVTTQLSAGGFHTCALTPDGAIDCWGRNDHGQLDVPPGIVFQQVAAGYLNTCAIDELNNLLCWGRNEDGESSPPTGSFSWVSTYGENNGGVTAFSCAIDDGGAPACWGDNASGQSSPVPGDYDGIVAGAHHACAWDSNGEPTCWGELASALPAASYQQIDAGTNFSCGLQLDDEVACQGFSDGRLGPVPTGPHVEVATGHIHGCVVGLEGSVSCWGNAAWSAAQPPNEAFAHVSAGGGIGEVYNDHTCGVTETNENGMRPGRRDVRTQPSEKGVGAHLGVGGPEAVRLLEVHPNLPVGGALDGVKGERRAQEITAHPLQTLAVASVDGDGGVQLHAEAADEHR